jgi:hypothetical protein
MGTLDWTMAAGLVLLKVVLLGKLKVDL